MSRRNLDDHREAINSLAQQLASVNVIGDQLWSFGPNYQPLTPNSSTSHSATQSPELSTTPRFIVDQPYWIPSTPPPFYANRFSPIKPRPIWNAPDYPIQAQPMETNSVWISNDRVRLTSDSCQSVGFRHGYVRNHSTQTNEYRFCPFCKSNKETREVYESHQLRDSDDKLVCPTLRSYTCKNCKATGDEAHTESYCPFRPHGSPESLMKLKTKRTATGKKRIG